MTSNERRYRVVVLDAGERVYVNCECGNNLLRIQEDNHAMNLKQWSISAKELRSKEIRRQHPDEQLPGRQTEFGNDAMVRGRCSRCNIRHDITDVVEVPDSHIWLLLSFWDWLALEYPCLPRTVSTKNIGQLEDFSGVVSSDEKRGIKYAWPREAKRAAKNDKIEQIDERTLKRLL